MYLLLNRTKRALPSAFFYRGAELLALPISLPGGGESLTLCILLLERGGERLALLSRVCPPALERIALLPCSSGQWRGLPPLEREGECLALLSRFCPPALEHIALLPCSSRQWRGEPCPLPSFYEEERRAPDNLPLAEMGGGSLAIFLSLLERGGECVAPC